MPVQVLNQSIRNEIYRRTLAAVQREVAGAGSDPDHPMSLVGRCLEFAWQGYRIIKQWPGAPRTILQGGSAQWPRIPPQSDDGVSPTHFAYQWDPASPLPRLARKGLLAVGRRPDGRIGASLPEMHVWLGCPETGEIIDFTTGLWPTACKAILGLPWLAVHPPDYFWNFGPQRPEGVNYCPEREAIALIIALLHQQGRQYP